MKKTQWYCRIAPSLGGGFSGTPFTAWGTPDYDPAKHHNEPTVFFGLYGLPDFYALWRHTGRKAVLWAGSDIRHFVNGYWLEEGGKIKLDVKPLAQWINKHCESWVENIAEYNLLKSIGVKSKICPSFLGNVKDYKVTYKSYGKPMVYLSVSGDDFKLYGWDVVERIAGKVPQIIFNLYGNKTEWKSKHANVIVHGRIPQADMNADLEVQQSGLRPLLFDGASEILIKSVLMGQYPVSRIAYPHIDSYKTDEELIKLLKALANKEKPNKKGREYYLRTLNKYPWNSNK